MIRLTWDQLAKRAAPVIAKALQGKPSSAQEIVEGLGVPRTRHEITIYADARGVVWIEIV